MFGDANILCRALARKPPAKPTHKATASAYSEMRKNPLITPLSPKNRARAHTRVSHLSGLTCTHSAQRPERAERETHKDPHTMYAKLYTFTDYTENKRAKDGAHGQHTYAPSRFITGGRLFRSFSAAQRRSMLNARRHTVQKPPSECVA